jgi:hypothetical protein
MKIKTIAIELNRKRTMNYQSIGNSVGLTADLEDGDDPRKAVRELQRQALNLLLFKEGEQQEGGESGKTEPEV